MDVPPDPFASTAYGLAKLLAEGAARFIERVRNREVGGATDPAVISLIKEERQAPEFNFFKAYVTDRELRIQVQLGLALRRLQSKPGLRDVRESLRGNLQRRFGAAGHHVAELVANGVITAYLKLLVREESTSADVQSRLEGFLRNVDRFVLFVVAGNPVEQTLGKVRMRLIAHGPGTVVIFAKGSACRVLESILKRLRRDPERYVVEVITAGDQTTAFVSTPEVWLGADEIEPPKALLRAASKKRT
ncbi:MAG: hypothetical protein L3J95_02430 [Thermoplasmata archaeon]|nr:hypothetical protein [Thermoplasmata archaeon]MCI4359263.1 hypothetical protein [Thermoplasmata archaeon]